MGVHRLANMAGHEPGRLVRNAQLAGQLLPGNIALAAKQMIGIEPDIQRHFRALIDGADGHAEGFLAGVAPINARTSRFALENGNSAYDFAVRTNWAVLPQQVLKVFAGRIGVGEAGWRLSRHEYNPL